MAENVWINMDMSESLFLLSSYSIPVSMRKCSLIKDHIIHLGLNRFILTDLNMGKADMVVLTRSVVRFKLALCFGYKHASEMNECWPMRP